VDKNESNNKRQIHAIKGHIIFEHYGDKMNNLFKKCAKNSCFWRKAARAVVVIVNGACLPNVVALTVPGNYLLLAMSITAGLGSLLGGIAMLGDAIEEARRPKNNSGEGAFSAPTPEIK
jgi:hypothetical protein